VEDWIFVYSIVFCAVCPAKYLYIGSSILFVMPKIGSLLVLSVLLAYPVFATEYYIDPTGSDSNPGTESSPFASLSYGVARLVLVT